MGLGVTRGAKGQVRGRGSEGQASAAESAGSAWRSNDRIVLRVAHNHGAMWQKLGNSVALRGIGLCHVSWAVWPVDLQNASIACVSTTGRALCCGDAAVELWQALQA
ncbi:MAG: hypothetical protein B7Y02_05780, partial [Rhodobacterales bacterium 17-64-5]